jgi:hypothetical protein
MTQNIKLLSLLLVLLVNTATAQTTAIPDPNFEQALIELNIDSDGLVNGQVLTADVENIVELDFSNLYDSFFYNGGIINDFTGIENFTALEILNLTNLTVLLQEEQSDVFNSNTNLKEFRADTGSFDVGPFIQIPYLDFSNLDNLEYISLVTSFQINSINLNNPNSNYENLTIDLSHEYWDPPNNTYTVCINVSNAQAAANNQFPYNTWNIISPQPDQNGYVFRDYDFSSTCTLSITDFENINSISAYPNPVHDKLWLENPHQIEIEKAEIYNISGKLISSYSSVNEFIDVQALKAGVYFVKVYGKKSSGTLKMLKK